MPVTGWGVSRWFIVRMVVHTFSPACELDSDAFIYVFREIKNSLAPGFLG
jgi:hypothetical protein